MGFRWRTVRLEQEQQEQAILAPLALWPGMAESNKAFVLVPGVLTLELVAVVVEAVILVFQALVPVDIRAMEVAASQVGLERLAAVAVAVVVALVGLEFVVALGVII